MHGRLGVGRGSQKEKRMVAASRHWKSNRKAGSGEKRLPSRKLGLYEDYCTGNITKEKYREKYENTASRILEIEKRIPELKDEIMQVKEQMMHMKEREAERVALVSHDIFDKGKLATVIATVVLLYSEERIEIVWKMDDGFLRR